MPDVRNYKSKLYHIYHWVKADLNRKAGICEASLDRLADTLESAAPDVVVIIGDDQGELFSPSNQPAVAIFHGDRLIGISNIREAE